MCTVCMSVNCPKSPWLLAFKYGQGVVVQTSVGSLAPWGGSQLKRQCSCAPVAYLFVNTFTVFRPSGAQARFYSEIVSKVMQYFLSHQQL